MADIVDLATRSRMMSGIRSKDTRSEIAIRHGLHKLGFRYRLHSRNLPGKPDMTFARFRAVIFVQAVSGMGMIANYFDCLALELNSGGPRLIEIAPEMNLSKANWQTKAVVIS